MRFFVLATDYDGTLAEDGVVSDATVEALERLVDTGRRLVMVTGRELPELLEIFPQIELFEWVVAENGALLYRPSNREQKLLCEPPCPEFLAALTARQVAPVSVGQGIVATWEPYQTAVLEAIRECGLELQVIFNKGAVMVLPSGVNKASGLLAALKLMGVSRHETVGVGDAENDHAFLELCECSAAVANALPSLKERANIVLTQPRGAGVSELIDHWIEAEDDGPFANLSEHDLHLGGSSDGQPAFIPAYGSNLLIAGPSGSGKSTTTTSLMERLVEQQYQFCVIDPEGDYDNLPFAIAVGTGDHGPSVQEVLQVLSQPEQNVVVNLIGLKLSERPAFFSRLLPQLLELRSQCGRPHWLIIDEAHHLWPPDWELGTALAATLNRTLLITVHPDQIHADVLKSVGRVIAVGANPATTIADFCEATERMLPTVPDHDATTGTVIFWDAEQTSVARAVQVVPSTIERHRHIRKYAEGELPPDRSFYFRGPTGKLQLRAQNLILFLQLAEGVDDETWEFHRTQGDYSRWFRDCVKDAVLADEAVLLEQKSGSDISTAREELRRIVEQHYTLPAITSRRADDDDLTAEKRE